MAVSQGPKSTTPNLPAALSPDDQLLVMQAATCCGDPKNLDGNAHPWVHVSEDGPGDVYRCPVCGAIDVD